MDSIFGIGAPELILILILAGIVMGPQRISQVARWLGKTTAQLQAISRNFMRQLNAELAADERGELKSALEEVQALRRQINELRSEITSVATAPIQEGKKIVQESQQLAQQAVTLPENDEEAAETAVPTPKPPKPEIKNQIAPPHLTQLPNLVEVPDDPE